MKPTFFSLSICTLLFLWFQSHSAAAEALSAPWTKNYNKALTASSESGKPILVYFGADWCGPCQHFKKSVGNRSAFLSYARENLILLQGDLTSQTSASAQIQKLSQDMKVRGIPHLGLIDEKGQIIERKISRASTPEGQIGKIQSSLDSYVMRQKILEVPILATLVANPVFAAGGLLLVLLCILFGALALGGSKKSPKEPVATSRSFEFPSPDNHRVLVMGQLMEYRVESGMIYTSAMDFSLDGAVWLVEGSQLKLSSGTIMEFHSA